MVGLAERSKQIMYEKSLKKIEIVDDPNNGHQLFLSTTFNFSLFFFLVIDSIPWTIRMADL